MVNGDHAIFVETLTLIQDGAGAGARPRNLVDLTTALPEGESAGWFSEGEVESRCKLLREQRLLLITCADAAIARAAAYAVLGGLGVKPRDARLLSFADALPDDDVATIQQLRKGPGDPPGEMVVVVDAVGPRAHPFLDSLLNPEGVFAVPAIRGTLARDRLLVVCLAEPDAVVPRGGHDPPFGVWPVPFIEPLLRAAYPDTFRELAREIVKQRARGRWSPDDVELAQQLRGRLAQGRVAADVAAGGLPGARPSRTAHPNSVHMSVLYTAVHFSRLALAEFDRVVRVLLGDGHAAAPGDGRASPGQGAALRRWEHATHRIMRECGLVVGAQTAGSGVSFADAATRDHLRERFATEYAVYAHGRFLALHAAGLLFDANDDVAAGMIELTAEMAVRSPESYGGEWLAYLYLRTIGRDGEGASEATRRFAQLLRRFGGDAALRRALGVVLERLLAAGRSDAVLALAREIRFVPGIDALHWLRQAVDRGGDRGYRSARLLLLETLRAMAADPFPLLERIAEWLPASRDAREHSRSSRLALRLLPEYAMETVVRMNHADRGAWPTTHPLLAARDVRQLDRNAALLVRWLLHADVAEAVFGAKSAAWARLGGLVAELLAEWTFILYGSRRTIPPTLPWPVRDGAECTPDHVLAALVARIAGRLAELHEHGMAQAIVGEWEKKKSLWDAAVTALPRRDRAVRPELVWKRKLLRALISRFRKAILPQTAGECRRTS